MRELLDSLHVMLVLENKKITLNNHGSFLYLNLPKSEIMSINTLYITENYIGFMLNRECTTKEACDILKTETNTVMVRAIGNMGAISIYVFDDFKNLTKQVFNIENIISKFERQILMN